MTETEARTPLHPDDPTIAIDRYLAAYGEADTTIRNDLITRSFTSDAHLADPPFTASGHDELSAAFAAVQEQFPGHRFTRASGVDHHHDVARYAWVLVDVDGDTALADLDVVTFGPDGRIARVTGFIGDLPPDGNGA